MAERDAAQARKFAKKEWGAYLPAPFRGVPEAGQGSMRRSWHRRRVAGQAGGSADLRELAARAPVQSRDNWEELNKPMGAGDEAVNIGESRQKVKGLLRDFDCSGPTPRVKLETEDHKTVAFMFDDPKRVSVRGTGAVEYEFTCGAQEGPGGDAGVCAPKRAWR